VKTNEFAIVSLGPPCLTAEGLVHSRELPDLPVVTSCSMPLHSSSLHSDEVVKSKGSAL